MSHVACLEPEPEPEPEFASEGDDAFECMNTCVSSLAVISTANAALVAIGCAAVPSACAVFVAANAAAVLGSCKVACDELSEPPLP